MKRIKLFLSALILSLSSMFMLAVPSALAATATWDGGGGDDDMMTAANWVGDTAPSAGDDLVFPGPVAGPVVNDFTAATSFNSITFNGAGSSTGYTFTGNSMTIVGGIVEAMTGTNYATQTLDIALIMNGAQAFTVSEYGTLEFGGVISGTGALTLSGAGYIRLGETNTYSGTTSVAVQVFVQKLGGLGTTGAATTISSSGQVQYSLPQADKAGTIAEPFTLSSGTYDSEEAVLSGNAECGFSYCDDANITFSGAITFSQNTLLGAFGKITLTGALSGAEKTVGLDIISTGVLVLNGSSNTTATANGTYGAGVETTKTLSGNSPNAVISVVDKHTVIVTGTYGSASVYEGGVLKGTGTLGAVYVGNGGKLAPGLSPGCLNTGGLTFVSGSTYEYEIGGTTACSGFDQTVVTGAVDLGSGALGVSLYNGFKPAAGQKYVIISNDASDAVTGTFSGLAQGATFTVSGYTFSISYTGGDGNDVELTVTAVAPDTGFEILTNNPFLTMSLMLGAAGAIAFMARRSHKPLARKR